MFKKLIANKGKEFAGKLANLAQATNAKLSATDSKPEQQNASAATSNYSVDQRPFKINLNDLYQYDYEELSECVHQYEDYVIFLRQKYYESIKFCGTLEQEIEQLKQSKNASGDKTDSTKHNQALDLFEPNLSSGFSPSSSKNQWELELKQIEDFVTEKVCLNCVDEGLLQGITETNNNLVEQLSNIRDQLFQSPAPDGSEFVTVQLKKSTQDDLINVIGDIEMTVQLVFPKLLDINPKIKNQEKLIIKEVLQKVEGLLKSKQNPQKEEIVSPNIAKMLESELNDLKEQLETAKSKISDLESELEEKNQKEQQQESAQSENNIAQEEQPQEEVKSSENYNTDNNETDNQNYQQEIQQLNESKKELEKKIKELDSNLKKANNSCKDYENKIKQGGEKINGLEKVRKDFEVKVKDLETRSKELEQRLKEAEEKNKELEKKKRESDAKINQLRSQNEEAKEQLEWLRKEHQKLISTAERAEGETNEEVTKLHQEIQTLENEKKILQDKAHQEIEKIENEKKTLQEKAIEAEHSKTDMENKLIQERLRHHQTVVDMQKLNETLKQAEKNLDDEMEAHRKTLDKIEIYKSKIVESDKKKMDYKKTIKKLSQQILELHSKLNDISKKEQSGSQNQDELKDDFSTEVLQDVKLTDRDLITSPTNITQSRGDFNSSLDAQSIKQLQIQLEEAQHEANNLKALNTKLTTENQSILSQNKTLQEKREIGLQEIQKLSQSLEKLKVQYPDLDFSAISQSVIPKEVSDKISYQPSSALSMHRISSSTSSAFGQNDSSPLSTLQKQSSSIFSTQPGKSNLTNIKKHLDQLYKEVIMALTNETITSIKQKSNESKGQAAELELEQHLVKIEKKVNDVILLLNDYSELISKFFKKASELQNI